MIEAILQEISLRKIYLQNQTVETIYFGGGTPSVLEAAEIERILNHITGIFSVSSDAEITLEANPDDLNSKKVKELRNTPINRFSIGTQSFFDEDLIWMNRPHNAIEAETSIKRVQDAGFENITLDLIYGFPLLTNQKWVSNIIIALQLDVPHISSYSITVEPKTALASFIKRGKQAIMSDAQSADQFVILMEKLEDAGFEHYEISNFAKPGRYSKHNSNYWNGIPYLGVGPSAHSFNGETRQWNVADNGRYIESLSNAQVPAEIEELTLTDRVNEYIMTSLRTMWGMDLNKIKNDFGPDYKSEIEKSLIPFIANNSITQKENSVVLTRHGKLFADHIAGELFLEEGS